MGDLGNKMIYYTIFVTKIDNKLIYFGLFDQEFDFLSWN